MKQSAKLKVEIWSDVMCPFCYIGKRRLEGALEKFSHRQEVEIEWKSFQLDPNATSSPGKSTYQRLADKYGKDLNWAIEMSQSVTEQAKSVGLDFNFDKSVVANSFDAHRLAHLAKIHGVGNELEEVLFKAYFTEGKNVSDHQTLVELGKEVKLDETEIREMLDSDRFAEEVRNDISMAQQFNISGVPFFVLDRKYAISGAQSEDAFLETLEKSYENWDGKNQFQILNPTNDNTVCSPDGICE